MEPVDKEKFGAFLGELRREKGLTQQELAEKLYVSNKAVSKWERGRSLPDISLLPSLGELLGVTVTELLKGEHMTEETMEAREAEELVGKTIRLSGEGRRGPRCIWRLAWVLCAVLAVLETGTLAVLKQVSATELWNYLFLVEGLSLCFGAYFCFFARETLPAYYDENRIGFYSDGPFRMNLPGVHFNNGNWPYIVKTARWCLLGAAVLFPPVFAAAREILPDKGLLALTLLFSLGFFVPLMISAKRHQ